MWKQWKKAAVVLMACTMLLNMTGCKKQEEKLKSLKRNRKPGKRMKKRQRAKRKRFRRIKNLLTGLADLSETAIGKRPVAVMVEQS